MRWKNGAGRTTEIAVHPAGAALDAFDWRVSVADVAGDGPFSPFAGVDRTIVLLAGAGIRLARAAEVVVLRTPYEPYPFSGDDAIDCALVDGPVRDFNLMVRRGRGIGEIVIVRGAAAPIAPARFCLCYAANGTSVCRIAGRPPLRLAGGHALLVDGELLPLAVDPLTTDAVAVVVRIE